MPYIPPETVGPGDGLTDLSAQLRAGRIGTLWRHTGAGLPYKRERCAFPGSGGEDKGAGGCSAACPFVSRTRRGNQRRCCSPKPVRALPLDEKNIRIYRDGLENYQRNNLTGDGVQQFAPAAGTEKFDAAVCD